MGLTDYIELAMGRAKYKILKGGQYFGSIPGFRGVWADARSLETCRTELREVLEDWIVLKLRDGDMLPAVGGRRLKLPTPVHA